jgi:DNA-binding transcriptional LysR family regulator
MIDAQLLPAFIAVAETGSFTQAAARTGLSQSSISQRVRRLEDSLGKPLFLRDTHRVEMTSAGVTLLEYARSLLNTLAEAELRVRDSSLTGEVRLGIVEDIAISRLPRILQNYRRAHANVELHVEVDMSLHLLDRLEKREFDLVLCKRLNPRHHPAMRSIYAEPLVWVGVPGAQGIARMRPLPLALHSDPSVTRRLVVDRLADAGIPYRVSHTSWSIAGIQAGVAAGLGISACGRGFVPPALCALDASEYGLPELPALDFVLARRQGELSRAAEELAALVERNPMALEYPRLRTAQAPLESY